MVMYQPVPLTVPPEDQQRVADAWRLRMMLDGTWRSLLAEHGFRQLGRRASLVGEWDTSVCLIGSVLDQTTAMYDTPPQLNSPDEVLRESFARGRWWQKARQHQRYVRGLRDSLVFVGWDSETGYPTFQLVTPDLVTIETSPTNRERPVTIWRAAEKSLPWAPGQKGWLWERWSVAGGFGSYTIWTGDRQRDVTAAFLDPRAWQGDAYPYRDEDDGRPILPFVLYHSGGGGCGVWNPHGNQEIAFGTLQVGLLWTALVHGFLRASWVQKVLLNGRIKGGVITEMGNTQVRLVTPDPTSVLEVDGAGGGTAAIDEWGASFDAEAAEQTVRRYENRLAVHFGLSPADLVIESLNPASGASITVSQTGKRQIAQRDLVHFADADLELARVVAAVNRGWGRPCSARGARVRYRGIALTSTERETLVRTLTTEMDRGLADRVSVYQELHPGTTEEDAADDLRVIDFRRLRDRVISELLAGRAPAPAPVPVPAAA